MCQSCLKNVTETYKSLEWFPIPSFPMPSSTWRGRSDRTRTDPTPRHDHHEPIIAASGGQCRVHVRPTWACHPHATKRRAALHLGDRTVPVAPVAFPLSHPPSVSSWCRNCNLTCPSILAKIGNNAFTLKCHRPEALNKPTYGTLRSAAEE